MSRFTTVSLGLYIACMAAVVMGLITAKGCAIGRYGTAVADDDWQQWREAASKDAEGDGPVRRRVPKSDDPPLLVLLTEHFWVLLVSSLVFGSVLYFLAYFFIQGTISHGAFEVRKEQE